MSGNKGNSQEQESWNYTNELADLLDYVGGIATVIRMYSAYSRGNDGQESPYARYDLLWLSDHLHNYNDLAKAISSGSRKSVVEVCDRLVEQYEEYLVNESSYNSKACFERLQAEFHDRVDLKRAANIFERIRAKAMSFNEPDSANWGHDISTLGLSPLQFLQFSSLIHQPHGLILFTGLCGSGKTVSLYATIRTLGQDEKKVATVEDPIEDALGEANVKQHFLSKEHEQSMASAATEIIRSYNPDVLMIGEIRDRETAEVAVRLAASGYLVLASIQATEAITAIRRLVEMGGDRTLLSQVLHGVLSHHTTNAEGRTIEENRFHLTSVDDALRSYIANMGGSSEQFS